MLGPRRKVPASTSLNNRSSSFTGHVRDLASDGRGVVTAPDGKVFLVAGAWLGEVVEVSPTGGKGQIGFGAVKTRLESASVRRQPPCRHHGFEDGQCGGCPWQFVDYPAQLSAKDQRVRAMCTQLDISAELIQPIVAAPGEWQYRNRAQFKTDGELLGYVSTGSNTLADIHTCSVLTPANQASLKQLRARLPVQQWRPEKRHRWRTLNIDDTLEGMSVDERLPFRQGNSAQNVFMQRWLAWQIKDYSTDWPVLEFFCGTGNFTTVLAKHFHTVTAVEGNRRALDALDAGPSAGVVTVCCDLFDDAAVDVLCKKNTQTKVLVLDPPRDGLKIRAPVFRRLRDLEVIFYMSCDLATWRRDYQDFCSAGFSLAELQAIDLFPQTPHVEVLSVLCRR